MMYRLTVEDIKEFKIEEGSEAFYIDTDKDLKQLMTEYSKKGYFWLSGEKPADFNPWTTWVDADGYVIGVFENRIWCSPIDQEDFEETIGHKI